MDKIFDYLKVYDDRQVKMVAYILKGATSAWWDRVQTTFRRHGELPIVS